ncbi:MAG: DUF2141 domain-containing protein [Halothiobacillus sp.]|jgi:uncharacterized protein (DUF2141 family)|nr:DUF2141 domain-containing protein [Halothiobacillus sp.]
MDESTTRKAAAAFTDRGPKSRIPMRVRHAAWLVAPILVSLPALGLAHTACTGIHVKIVNIRNSVGTIDCALFDSPKGFPKEFLRNAKIVMILKIQNSKASCFFPDIPPGRYAIAVVHDENMNGKLDTNLLGIPTEGYGFSNKAKASLSAPAFSAASFKYNGQNMYTTMKLDN